MSPPNSRHSEARNSHIASLVFEMPVFVSAAMWACGAAASWSATAMSANGLASRSSSGTAASVSASAVGGSALDWSSGPWWSSWSPPGSSGGSSAQP